MTEKSSPKRDLDYYMNLSYPVHLSHISEEDGDYWLAEVLDLPGCMADGTTPNEAMEELQDAKQLWIETAIEDGCGVPEPTSAHDYSGRLLLRMPRSLHQRVATQAKREGVSLNQHLVAQLSSRSGESQQIADLAERVSRIYHDFAFYRAHFAMLARMLSAGYQPVGRGFEPNIESLKVTDPHSIFAGQTSTHPLFIRDVPPTWSGDSDTQGIAATVHQDHVSDRRNQMFSERTRSMLPL